MKIDASQAFRDTMIRKLRMVRQQGEKGAKSFSSQRSRWTFPFISLLVIGFCCPIHLPFQLPISILIKLMLETCWKNSSWICINLLLFNKWMDLNLAPGQFAVRCLSAWADLFTSSVQYVGEDLNPVYKVTQWWRESSVKVCKTHFW